MSQRSRTRRDRPGALGAEHEHDGSVARSPRSNRLAVGGVVEADDPEPARPSSPGRRGRPDRPRPSARYSTAPAAALATVGVTCTARWRGSTTPVTPAPSAERSSAPRLPGSVTPSTATRNGAWPGPAGGGELVEVGLGQRGGLGQHALGRLAAGLRLEALAADVLDRHPLAAARSTMSAMTLGVVEVGGDPQLADLAPAGDQQLAHRLATLDLLAAEALGPACRGGAPAPAAARRPRHARSDARRSRRPPLGGAPR